MFAEATSRVGTKRNVARQYFPIEMFLAQDEKQEVDEGGNSLEDVVRDEVELPRERLRAELGREPTEEETKEWLRQHTEGY